MSPASPDSQPRLLLLAGNTNLRYGIFAGGELQRSGAIAWSELPAGGFQTLRSLLEEAHPEVIAASVRDDHLAEALSIFPRGRHRVLKARVDFEIPIENAYEPPSAVGTDRLLNAYRAAELWPGESAVVVDCGTALSISTVSPQGVFTGGLIAPGIGTACRALRAAAPRLPPARPRPLRPLIQATTQGGVDAGTYWQLVGGLARILSELRSELPPPVRVALTGGDAELAATGLEGVDIADSDWTLKGLHSAWRTAVERAEGSGGPQTSARGET